MKVKITYHLSSKLEQRAKLVVSREIFESFKVFNYVMDNIHYGPNFRVIDHGFYKYAYTYCDIISIPALLEELTKSYLTTKKAVAALHPGQVFRIK